MSFPHDVSAIAGDDARESFILENLRPAPVPMVPEITIYAAHAASGLGRLSADAPYFAYPWAGGIALARYLLDHPDEIAGRTVLDLGTGSGLVAIAAALGGGRVTAVDTDPLACAAARVNAALNRTPIEIVCADPLGGPPADAEIVLAGDVFYAPRLARRAAAWLERCADAGVRVLVGDPGRRDLPVASLVPVSSLRVADFGSAGQPVAASAYAFLPRGRL